MSANFLGRGLKAQPATALDAFWIKALNGSAGESMHGPPQKWAGRRKTGREREAKP